MNLSHSFPATFAATFCRHSWLLFSCFLFGGDREREAERVGERPGYNRILVNLFPLASQASPTHPTAQLALLREKMKFFTPFSAKGPVTGQYCTQWGGRGSRILRICMLSTWFLASGNRSCESASIYCFFSYHRLGTVSSAWHSCYPDLCMHYNIIILIYLPLSHPRTHSPLSSCHWGNLEGRLKQRLPNNKTPWIRLGGAPCWHL